MQTPLLLFIAVTKLLFFMCYQKTSVLNSIYSGRQVFSLYTVDYNTGVSVATKKVL
jgi:hypothetical protein